MSSKLVTPAENIKLLLACLHQYKAGTIDFNVVAANCGINNADTARKRYTRLKKAHDHEFSAKASPFASKANKKRKLDDLDVADDASHIDDEETTADSTPCPKGAKVSKELSEQSQEDTSAAGPAVTGEVQKDAKLEELAAEDE